MPLEHNQVARQSRSTSGSRNLDLRQIKLAIQQQHSRRAQSTDGRTKKTQITKSTKINVEPQPPRPRTWPAQAQLKTKIISSSDSSRTSSPALKKLNKKSELIQTKVKEKSDKVVGSVAPSTNKTKVTNFSKQKIEKKTVSTSTLSIKTERNTKLKKDDTTVTKQKSTVSQPKTKTTSNILKTNNKKVIADKVLPPKTVPTLNKENRTNTNSGKQSKSGSSSSTQQSPSMMYRNRQTNSTNTSTPSSQTRTDSNPYSGSPSLRRSLLLAARTPQVPVKPVSPATNKRLARIQASNSLTSPTKSSAAKCVSNNTRTKVVKQSSVTKNNADKPVEKATVERSGTFLKDEPTVLNKN